MSQRGSVDVADFEQYAICAASFWLALTISLGAFALAFALRFAFGDTLGSVPFITLFPAILVAALIGGLCIGMAVTLLSGLAAIYFFIPPYRIRSR